MPDTTRKGSAAEVALGVWRRRKWLAVTVFAASLSVAGSLAIFLPNVYRSTATVLVERQQVTETFVRPAVTGELETRFQTMSQQILSRSRLQDLMLRFDLYPDLRKRMPLDEVAEQMRRDIRLELKGADQTGGRGATIAFTISYRGRDPEAVALVTNTLASFYIEENLKARERQATGTAEFLKLQLDETKARLDQQERRVGDLRKRYAGELPQQVAANLAILERLNTQLRLSHDNQLRALERRETLTKQLAEADSLGPEATGARLARLSQELADLQMRFSEKYPDVIRLKADIAALERQLAATQADGRPPTQAAAGSGPSLVRLKEGLSQTEAEIKALKAEEQRLREAIATYERRVENAPGWEQDFRELSRDYEATKESYYSLLKRYEEAQLAESMEQRRKGEQFRILDPAVAWKEPAGPNRVRLLLVGLVLSLAAAAWATVLTERMDPSFHTVEDLKEFTSVPVLARIPRIVTRAGAARRRLRLCLGAVPVLLGLALLVGAAYYVAHDSEQLVWMLTRGQP